VARPAARWFDDRDICADALPTESSLPVVLLSDAPEGERGEPEEPDEPAGSRRGTRSTAGSGCAGPPIAEREPRRRRSRSTLMAGRSSLPTELRSSPTPRRPRLGGRDLVGWGPGCGGIIIIVGATGVGRRGVGTAAEPRGRGVRKRRASSARWSGTSPRTRRGAWWRQQRPALRSRVTRARAAAGEPERPPPPAMTAAEAASRRPGGDGADAARSGAARAGRGHRRDNGGERGGGGGGERGGSGGERRGSSGRRVDRGSRGREMAARPRIPGGRRRIPGATSSRTSTTASIPWRSPPRRFSRLRNRARSDLAELRVH